ncbi:MAG: molybdopterin adenylyltransferase [Acidobacteriota bacterium]|nr:molybdopterin adenylyltransferase [Acidobacteriota bacterium]MDH3523843.1 molybdopterin adenylyltransferase [Acidobacteriota bacterium]
MAIPRIGILTVSDRASRGEYPDRSGPAVRAFLMERLAGRWEALERVVADEREAIEAALAEMADRQSCCLVITTGGTGPHPRDVTPEATAAVCDRLLPGIGERMRAVSVESVPTAVLSRQVAGLRGSCLVVNLPGSPRAIRQCLDAVFAALPHAIELAGGPELELASPPELPH